MNFSISSIFGRLVRRALGALGQPTDFPNFVFAGLKLEAEVGRNELEPGLEIEFTYRDTEFRGRVVSLEDHPDMSPVQSYEDGLAIYTMVLELDPVDGWFGPNHLVTATAHMIYDDSRSGGAYDATAFDGFRVVIEDYKGMSAKLSYLNPAKL